MSSDIYETRESCGCVIKRTEHDFWSYEQSVERIYCTEHEKYHKVNLFRWENNRVKRELDRIKKINDLKNELQQIVDNSDSEIYLSEIVKNIGLRRALIKRHKENFKLMKILDLKKKKNKWLCKENATLCYIDLAYEFDEK